MMKTACSAAAVLVCFVTAAGGQVVGQSRGVGETAAGYAFLTLILFALVILTVQVVIIVLVGRLILRPTVRELDEINRHLSALVSRQLVDLPEEVNQIAQQVYGLSQLLSKGSGTPVKTS